MRFVIVTGMSGAGKSTALNILEDEGYFCADNIPLPLVEKFAELSGMQENGYSKVALGVDIRSGIDLKGMPNVLESLTSKGIDYEILYLDASDPVLLKRFKETRRSHPLARDGRLEDGIAREREALQFLKKQADFIIDTSKLLTRELKEAIEKIFVSCKEYRNIFVTILSFGFKYGIPADSDLVFDVRFLPNPFYVEELRSKRGAGIRDEDRDCKPVSGKAGGYDRISSAELRGGREEPACGQHWLYRRTAPFRHSGGISLQTFEPVCRVRAETGTQGYRGA